MDYKQVLKDIKNNSLRHLYLFYGEEFLLLRMLIENIQRALINPQFEQLNVNYLDGKTIGIDDIINTCETLPFMDENRLVIVENSPLLHGSSGATPKEVDRLCKYFESIPDTTYMIFTSRDIDKKRKLYKAISKAGEVVEYKKLDKTDLSKWVAKRFRLEGKKIDGQSIELFISLSDYLNKDSKVNLSDIENEIAKVVAYTSGKNYVTVEDIENTVEENMDTNIFKMLELIGEGDIEESIKRMNMLIDDGEAPIKILFMLVRQIRIIYQSKLLSDSGYTSGDIAKIMGERPFVISKALRQARRFSYKKLIYIYKYASQIDKKIKSGQIDPVLALEMLLIKC